MHAAAWRRTSSTGSEWHSCTNLLRRSVQACTYSLIHVSSDSARFVCIPRHQCEFQHVGTKDYENFDMHAPRHQAVFGYVVNLLRRSMQACTYSLIHVSSDSARLSAFNAFQNATFRFMVQRSVHKTSCTQRFVLSTSTAQ